MCGVMMRAVGVCPVKVCWIRVGVRLRCVGSVCVSSEGLWDKGVGVRVCRGEDVCSEGFRGRVHVITYFNF